MDSEKKQKIIRVAVIGGGASGWSAVRALEEDPHPAVRFETTIYEKEERWGGKCCTVVLDNASIGSRYDGNSEMTPGSVNKRPYEMGAGAISGSFAKPTENYADLLKLIERSGLNISLIERADRPNYVFYEHGKKRNLLSWGTVVQNIPHFLKVKYDIWRNYTSNLLEYKDILKRYPLLTQHVSHRYANQAVLDVLAKAGPGYGYGDQDDPHLTAPLLYFLDFIKSEQAASPLFSIDQGMQAIWSQIAQSYRSAVHQRLGETVTGICRTPSGITIETDKNGVGDQYDKLVIATPLQQAQKFMDYTEREQRFLNRVKYNHYVSVLCQVEVAKDAVGWVNVPNSVDRSRLGQVVFSYKPYADSPWMVNYLYLTEEADLSDHELVDRVATSLKEGLDAKLIDKKTTVVCHWPDYFAHLDRAGLESGWYERFDRDFQDRNHTLYVGTPLHMESVGHSVRYAFPVTQNVRQRWIKETQHRRRKER